MQSYRGVSAAKVFAANDDAVKPLRHGFTCPPFARVPRFALRFIVRHFRHVRPFHMLCHKYVYMLFGREMQPRIAGVGYGAIHSTAKKRPVVLLLSCFHLAGVGGTACRCLVGSPDLPLADPPPLGVLPADGD